MKPITVHDAQAVADMEMVLFSDNCFNEATLRREIELGEGWVIYDGEQLVGYLLAKRSGMPKRNESILDILRLGVRSSHQGKGIGTRMLKETLDENDAMLCVRRGNTRAIKLYYHHGFRILGHTEDSWVMLRKGHIALV